MSAGEGRRMRPLTLNTPKPLLKVGNQSLIEHHLNRLKSAGITNIVINTSYAGEKFTQTLGDGTEYGVNIKYSHERGTRLETGGGIQNALPLLESDPFLVVNADIWTDYSFEAIRLTDNFDCCLILVNNPQHNCDGDFVLREGVVQIRDSEQSEQSFTYSGISLMRKSLFNDDRGLIFPLIDVFLDCIRRGKLTGQYYGGKWMDIGTPERLNELEKMIQSERIQTTA